MQISFSSSFRRAFKKLVNHNQALEKKFWKKTEVFIKNPYHSSLKTHKLTGEPESTMEFFC